MTDSFKRTRLSYITARLMDGGQFTYGYFARYFQCSERTIQRDFNSLKDEGLPIKSSSKGHFLDPPEPEEITKTNHSVFASLLLAGGAIDKRFEHLFPKLALGMKKNLFNVKGVPYSWDSLHKTTSIEHSSLSNKELNIFGALARHILSELPVELEYKPIMQDSSYTLDVYPIQLKEREGIWYLLAYDYARQANRVYQLSRILRARISRASYAKPPQEAISDGLNSGEFSIWGHGKGTAQHFKIKLTGYAAHFIQERKLHPTQKLEIVAPDTVILSLETNDETGVNLWLRKFAPFVTVLEPQSLRDWFVQDMRQALQNHE